MTQVTAPLATLEADRVQGRRLLGGFHVISRMQYDNHANVRVLDGLRHLGEGGVVPVAPLTVCARSADQGNTHKLIASSPGRSCR